MKQLTRKRNDHFRHKELKKKLIALKNEDEDLMFLSYRKYVELDEPLRMGFRRNLVFVQTADMFEDIADMERVLALIDMEYHSHTRDFRQYNHKLRKRIDLVHRPKALNGRQWAKLAQSNPELEGYFKARHVRFNWAGVEEFAYDFIAPEMLESKMSKWFVTRVPVLDSETDSRRQEIEEIFDGPCHLGCKLGHYYGWRYNYHDDFAETRSEIVARIDEKDHLEDYRLQGYELEDELDDM